MSFHGLRAHFSVALSHSLLSGSTTVYLPVHLLKGLLVASRFGQLGRKLLSTSTCRFLCGSVSLFKVSEQQAGVMKAFAADRGWQLWAGRCGDGGGGLGKRRRGGPGRWPWGGQSQSDCRRDRRR